MNYRILLLSFIAAILLASTGFAQSTTIATVATTGSAQGTGIVTVTAKYIDNGIEKPLENAYLYLHDSTRKPHPQQSVFNKPHYVLGPSDSSGKISQRVAAGTYVVRITKRNDTSTATDVGAPQSRDYTWKPSTTITITANATTDLGTAYASLYSPSTVITGTVTLQTGELQAGRYIRAVDTPCLTVDGYIYDLQQCGSNKPAAVKRTDANGQFTLELKDPGTFYIYTSTCRGGEGCTGEFAGSVTAQSGETKTLNIVTNN